MLFKIETKKTIDIDEPSAINVKNHITNEYLTDVVKSDFINSIGKIKMGRTIHYNTAGKWSMHELLSYLLSQTGAAQVYIATWSIKNLPANVICEMVENKIIQELHLLLDYKAPARDENIFALLQEHCTSISANVRTHAKITVIRNKQFAITIIGSANYTVNPSEEAGVIICSNEVADYRINFLTEKIKQSNE